jgi:hypothetical protein
VGDSGEFDRLGSGGDDAVGERYGRRSLASLHRNLIGCAEPAVAPKHVDSASICEPSQALGEVADHAILEGAHPLEVEARLAEVDAAFA